MSSPRYLSCDERIFRKTIVKALMPMVVLVAGCATINGPRPIVTADGPTANGRTGKLAANFNTFAEAALADDGTSDDAKEMLRVGFALNVASCNDYFNSAGKTQRWVIVANDYVGAAGTLATSILALTHAGVAAVSATALGTSTILAGTSIYTKDFLFASENIG